MAHYLILTHLRESMHDMPLLDAVGVGSRKRGAAAAAGDNSAAAAGQPGAKRARTDARDPSQLRHVCCSAGHLVIWSPARQQPLTPSSREACRSSCRYSVFFLTSAMGRSLFCMCRRERAQQVQAQVAALMSEFALLPASAGGGAAAQDTGQFSVLPSSLDDIDQDDNDGLLPGEHAGCVLMTVVLLSDKSRWCLSWH